MACEKRKKKEVSKDEKCEGCGRKFTRIGFSHHVTQTTNTACIAYRDTLYQNQNASLDAESSTHQSRHPSPVPDHTSNSHPEAGFSTSNLDSMRTFTGDYFGDIYTGEEFPGWEGDQVPLRHAEYSQQGAESGDLPGDSLDPSNGSRSQADEEEDDENSQHPDQPDQAHRWEPPPSSPTSDTPHTPMREDFGLDGDEELETRLEGAATVLGKRPVRVDTFPTTTGAGEIVQEPLRRQNEYDTYSSSMKTDPRNVYAPFASEMDWAVARWAKLQGPGSTSVSELLHIKGVSAQHSEAENSLNLHCIPCRFISTCHCGCQLVNKLGLSFRNSQELNTIIDTHLPNRRPRFHRQEVAVKAAGEAFDVYFRDVMECIKALYSDPEFAPHLKFAPERHYADEDGTQRLFHDMHTGRWWWNTQVSLCFCQTSVQAYINVASRCYACCRSKSKVRPQALQLFPSSFPPTKRNSHSSETNLTTQST